MFLFQKVLFCQISVVSLIDTYPQSLESKSVTFVDKSILIYGVPN